MAARPPGWIARGSGMGASQPADAQMSRGESTLMGSPAAMHPSGLIWVAAKRIRTLTTTGATTAKGEDGIGSALMDR